MSKFYALLGAVALMLLASNAQAAIVFDTFNTVIGTHFNQAANSSGTTNILHTSTGTANLNVTVRTTNAPFEGAGALQVGIVGGGQTVSSPGGNRLSGNGTADARNLRSGYTFKAEHNCWDHATAADVVASDVLGTVDVDALGSVCGSSTGGQAPSVPTGLRIVQQ